MMRPELWDDLRSFSAPNVFNPWRDSDVLDIHTGSSAPFNRQLRLIAHFNVDPKYLLIGEAPSYRGCHFSGIPFTSEYLLGIGTVPRIEQTGRLTHRRMPWREPSAAIVWKALYDAGIADRVIMWNAFAWHPYKPGNRLTNRRPTDRELEAGMHVLGAVLAHFNGAIPVAIGRVAQGALEQLGITVACTLRHPAYGGAKKFREGLRLLAKGDCDA